MGIKSMIDLTNWGYLPLAACDPDRDLISKQYIADWDCAERRRSKSSRMCQLRFGWNPTDGSRYPDGWLTTRKTDAVDECPSDALEQSTVRGVWRECRCIWHKCRWTDKDGRFQEIELIVGDEYTISVEAEGYREAETERFTAMAEMTQIADLVLLPAGGQFFIEGRVTDTSGEPVSGAQLSIIQQSQHWLTVTDENGDYRLEDLSMAVVLTLHIRHPGYAHHKFRILKTKQRHDLVLVKADGYLAGKVVDADGQAIVERVRVMIKAKEDPFFDYRYFPGSLTNLQGEFELKHIKDPIVSIQVSDETNLKTLKIFRDITVNQRDLVLTLTPPEPKPELTPEQQAEREAQQSYVNAAEERVKTLVNQPAPELSVAEWLSGSPTSIEDLKGKTIALHFWDLDNIHHVRQIRLLNILQEVYQDKGLVCVAICPAATVVETLKQHIAAESLPYSVGLDLSIDVVGARGETSDLYAVGGRSEIVLINTAGEIAGRAWDSELEDKIQVLLAD